jgi:hypothetical protein
MAESFRKFQVGPDVFGRNWDVEFLWIQNAISIRHADTVDVKFRVTCGDETMEKVIALPHPDLLALAAERRRDLTDAWCSRLAASHIKRMIETGEDLEKTLVTVPRGDLDAHAAAVAAG